MIEHFVVKKKIRADESLKISRMKEFIKPTKPHKHDNYHELILLSEGGGIHQIDSKAIEILPPMAFYLKPGQVHCWDFTKVPKGFVLLFKEDIVGKLQYVKDSLYEFPSDIYLPPSPALFTILEQMQQDFDDNPIFLEGLLVNYLNIIFLKLWGCSHTQRPVHHPSLNVVYEYKKAVNEHFQSLRQVHEYAQLLNLNAIHINQACKKNLAKNAQEIIYERILLEAKNLLSHTQLSVSEIAYALRFTDPSHFVKFFKKRTNFSPGKYRQIG